MTTAGTSLIGSGGPSPGTGTSANVNAVFPFVPGKKDDYDRSMNYIPTLGEAKVTPDPFDDTLVTVSIPITTDPGYSPEDYGYVLLVEEATGDFKAFQADLFPPTPTRAFWLLSGQFIKPTNNLRLKVTILAKKTVPIQG